MYSKPMIRCVCSALKNATTIFMRSKILILSAALGFMVFSAGVFFGLGALKPFPRNFEIFVFPSLGEKGVFCFFFFYFFGHVQLTNLVYTCRLQAANTQ